MFVHGRILNYLKEVPGMIKFERAFGFVFTFLMAKQNLMLLVTENIYPSSCVDNQKIGLHNAL